MTELTGKYTSAEWSELLVGESLLFGLLSRILYANPSRDWLQSMIDDEVFDSVPFAENHALVQQGLGLLSEWTRSLQGDLSDAEITELRADYAQLFIGNKPMRVPPWESVYFSEKRLTFQDETLDVRAWFERFGLQINSQMKEPDDHIAFELGFVAHCADLAFRALEEQDSERFAELIAAQRTFLEQHLLRWGCKWAELAYENARTDFYRGLALLVNAGLMAAAELLEANIPQKIRYPGLDIH